MTRRRLFPLIGLLLVLACDKRPENAEDRYDDEGNAVSQNPQVSVVVEQDTPSTMYAPRFPLPGFPGEQNPIEGHDHEPGEPEQMRRSIIAPKPAAEVADFYYQAMSDKGLSVQRSTNKTPDYDQVQLFGTSDTVTATVLVDQKVGEKTSSVIITWTLKK